MRATCESTPGLGGAWELIFGILEGELVDERPAVRLSGERREKAAPSSRRSNLIMDNDDANPLGVACPDFDRDRDG
eukprot:2929502-Pyramimonas_sp.AAC.1